MLSMLRKAAYHSIKGPKFRSAFIGALGVRNDGAVVSSYNGAILMNDSKSGPSKFPRAHAEARLAKKLDKGSIVYVARTRRDNGKIAMAKPCATCRARLKNKGVKMVYYTINENEWGVIKF